GSDSLNVHSNGSSQKLLRMPLHAVSMVPIAWLINSPQEYILTWFLLWNGFQYSLSSGINGKTSAIVCWTLVNSPARSSIFMAVALYFRSSEVNSVLKLMCTDGIANVLSYVLGFITFLPVACRGNGCFPVELVLGECLMRSRIVILL